MDASPRLLPGAVQFSPEDETVRGRDANFPDNPAFAVNGQNAMPHAKRVEPALSPCEAFGSDMGDILQTNPSDGKAQPSDNQELGTDAVTNSLY